MKFRFNKAWALGLAAILAVCGAQTAGGQEQGQEQEVRLSTLEKVESKDTIDHITQTDMERKTATNLWDALKGTLGVYQLGVGQRNEGAISIRGSHKLQTAMFIDDIPTGTTWRNEWDAKHYMLFDLESIEVSKGYSSPLLASNNGLAGVVNLRTAKPVKEMEFSAKYLNSFDRDITDQGRLFGASVGSKQELFYVKATVMQNEQDFFTLPNSFTPGRPYYEDGGRRDSSDFKNRAVNLITGWTPTEDVDIMFGMVRQNMEKGQPPNAASNLTNAQINAQFGGTGANQFAMSRRWPKYETERYYLNANVDVTEQAHLKALAYHDEHKDRVIGWTTPLSGIRFYNNLDSYEQYTNGGQLTGTYAFNEANKLALSAGYRRLSHQGIREYGRSNTIYLGTGLNRLAKEDMWDFGAEYTLKPLDPLTLVFGATHTRVNSKEFGRYTGTFAAIPPAEEGKFSDATKPDSTSLTDYQVGAFYELTEKHELFATVAQKSRFATMNERYGRFYPYDWHVVALQDTPYPDKLKPEKAWHYELGYRGLIQDWLKINTSVWYKNVTDQLVSSGIDYISDDDGSSKVYGPTRNIDSTKFYGFELGGEAQANQYLSAGLTFNYLEWSTDAKVRDRNGVIQGRDLHLTGAPKYTGAAYAVVSPVEGLSIIPQVNMSSSFYWSSDPTNPAIIYKEQSGFTTADLKAVYDYNEHLSFEMGAKNITDKEYAYDAYYPEPGRSFFMGLTARY
jgi:iron complex outermembrane receptor protein